MQQIRLYFDDFLNLFFPRLCAGCSASLFRGESLICTRCRYQLPRTGYHRWRNNPVEVLFWGRVPIIYGTAGFFFQKKGYFQHMVHAMKYRGMKELGKELGKVMGIDMAGSVFSEVDLLVPVPLHPEKLLKRGYNQSEWIAFGLGEALRKPVGKNILVRVIASETQTRKSRFDRWKNVENIFRIMRPDAIQGKHILLVDDVVTTGATLESCAHEILNVPGTKVSVATLAVA